MTDRDRPTIEHNRYELPNDTTPWRWYWLGVAALWVWTLVDGAVDWNSAALGGITGMLLASWAIVKTGGKVPESWRTKPPRG